MTSQEIDQNFSNDEFQSVLVQHNLDGFPGKVSQFKVFFYMVSPNGPPLFDH